MRSLSRLIFLGALIIVLSFGVAMVQMRQSMRSAAITPIDYQPGITYFSRNGYSLKLDLCKPKNLTSSVPGIVLIHGGGWVGGTRDRLTTLCQSLAQVGYVAATVDYRLAPTYRYPAQLDDVQYAVRWMRSKANLYRINPDFIISWGESAGGNLASMLGILNTRSSSMGLSQYSSKTQVVVNEFGPQDLTRAEYQNNPIMKSFLDKYIGYTFVQRPDLYRAASPFYQANTASAPLLTVSGNSDTDVPMADLVAMQQKLNSLGRVTETKIFPGAHNFIEPLEGSGQSGPVRQAEFSFVRNRTAGNLCQANAKTISQAVWINNLAYVRSVPVNLATKKPNWGNASGWVGPVSPDGLIPGSGPVNTDDIFIYPSAKKLIQSFWRSGEGYSREVPLKTDGTPDWNAAEPWPANPISANVYPPFSGEMQVSDSLLIGRGDTILQSYWRNNSGYIRYVAVDFFGHPAWNFTSDWTGPVSSSGLPGTATKPITAQTSIVYPDGTTLLQSFWRSDEGFTRTVPLNSLGYPDWNRAGQWSAGQISDLPVTGLPLTVTGMSMYYSDCN